MKWLVLTACLLAPQMHRTLERLGKRVLAIARRRLDSIPSSVGRLSRI